MTPMYRRAFIATAGAIATIGRAGAAEAPRRGGTLVATWGGNEPQAMFVPGGGGSSPYMTSTKMLERLMRMESDLSFTPGLATSIKSSADGRVFAISVRQGVTWHDGQKMTADDVAFSINQYWKPISAGLALKSMTEAVTTDSQTVEVRFERPMPELSFLSIASTEVILPKHIYADGDIRTNPANNAPVGTGPYKIKEWVRGSYVELVRNDSYWQPGLPYLDKLIIRWWSEPAARAAALETGELHLGIFNPIPIPQMRRLVKSGQVVVSQAGYENSSGTSTIEFNSRHPILSKREVRQAILHGIDAQFIADTVYFGSARPAMSAMLPANKLYYTEDTPKYPFDPGLAGKLLDAAGYKASGGPRFKVNLLAAGWYTENAKIGAAVKQNLGDIGIEANLTVPDRPTSLRRIYTDYDYDIALANQSQPIEPVPAITQYFTTDGILKGAAFRNANGYSNPDMDALVARIAVEIDPHTRKDLVAQFQRLVMTDVPLVQMVGVIANTVMAPNVRYAASPADIFGANWAELGFV